MDIVLAQLRIIAYNSKIGKVMTWKKRVEALYASL